MELIASSFPFLAFAGSIAFASYAKSKACNCKSSDVTVSELWVYPIKSCKGIKVDSAVVTARGFYLDRIFMVVDSTGKFVSQRSYPAMALIDVRVVADAAGNVLHVNAPGMPTLVVPTECPSASSSNFCTREVTVWGDVCRGVEALGEKDCDWFERYLNAPGVRLVRMKEDCVRRTEAKYAPNGQTGFADGFPFLLASESSLEYTNARLAEPITHARFRPNIIVRGSEAFDEDRWEKVRFHGVKHMNSQDSGLGSVDMSVVKPCARCTIPNIHPETATPHAEREPSRSMLAFRSGGAIGLANEKWGKQLFYGQNLDHEGQSGMVIRRGCRVQVLAAGGPFLLQK